jgi:hypothetical protein
MIKVIKAKKKGKRVLKKVMLNMGLKVKLENRMTRSTSQREAKSQMTQIAL